MAFTSPRKSLRSKRILDFANVFLRHAFRLQDVANLNRKTGSLRIAPLGQRVGVISQLPLGHVPELVENIVEQLLLGR